MNIQSFVATVIALGCFSAPALADKIKYTCTIQVAKGTCWGNHEVTFNTLIEGAVKKKIVLAKSEFDKTIEFPCVPRKVINFTASMDPPIFGKDETRLFPSKERWITPFSVPDNVRSWSVRVCFEKDFFNAPRPISDANTCECTFPKIKGEQN